MNANDVLAERQGAVLRVTLNRPDKHNALSRAVLERLRGVFAQQAADDQLKVAVLTGAGEVSFAAGGDLRDLAKVRTTDETRAMSEQARAALDAVREFPVPVVAALNGDARGGAAELAVACDFRVAAAHARIGFIQGRLNISTAWGGGTDLMRLLGATRALDVLSRSEMLPPERALAMGLIDAVATDDRDLETSIQVFIRPFLKQAPQVLRAFKALASAARAGAPRQDLYQLETTHLMRTWVHDDHWAAADGVLAKPKERNEHVQE
jgi:enoyl-CoA hydratase